MAFVWLPRLVSRTMMAKKHPRYIWNVFCIVLFLVVLSMFIFVLYQLLCEYICYQTTQIYVSHDEKSIYTNLATFALPTDGDIQINDIQSLTPGNNVVLTVSSLSGEIVKISSNEIVVYQISQVSLGIIIVATIYFVVMFTLIGFMLYVVNAKHPRGLVRKIQRQIEL